MTIKEIETSTGLPRANIRYYEERGFLTPARGANGYRDYSDEDIQTLLKVKLLRQLGFSLEEVRAVQRGELDLEKALEERTTQLEREQTELGQAARLCRDMRGDQVSYATLDAQYYLDRLAQAGEVLAQDRLPHRVFPWRRYFARMLDLFFYRTLFLLLLQVAFRQNVLHWGSGGKEMFLTAAGLVLMLALEPLFLHRWGSTPGKALFGLRITREDGSCLSFSQAFQRTGTIVLFLAVCEIPLVGTGLLIWFCYCVYHDKPLAWEQEDQVYSDGSDKEHVYWDKRSSWIKLLCVGLSYVLGFGLLWGGHQYAMMPRYRGADMTAAQFIENYNQFSAFLYGRENLVWEMNADGVLEKIDPNAVVISIMGDDNVPGFVFKEENGALTGVTIVQSGGGEEMTGFSRSEMGVSAWAFLCGQPGVSRKELSDAMGEILEQSGSFSYDLGGADISCQVELEGYNAVGNGMLVASGGSKRSYCITCTIALTSD